MSSWSTGLRSSSVHPYQDMAFHNGKVYAVANGGDLYKHEISEDSDTGEPKGFWDPTSDGVMGAPAPPPVGRILAGKNASG